MKHYVLWGLIVAAFFLLSSCGSSKKIQEKSPISTYIMPGADLISGNGILRGWGSGRSDSEASARKKAQMAASAELAAILAKTKSIRRSYRKVCLPNPSLYLRIKRK